MATAAAAAAAVVVGETELWRRGVAVAVGLTTDDNGARVALTPLLLPLLPLGCLATTSAKLRGLLLVGVGVGVGAVGGRLKLTRAVTPLCNGL